MEWAFLIGVLALTGLGWAGMIAGRSGNKKEFFAKLQERLGNERLDMRKNVIAGIPGLRLFTGNQSLKGTIGGKRFSIAGFQGIDKGADRVAIRLNHRLPFVRDLLIVGETSFSRMKKKMKGEDILTGDARFDGEMMISGDKPVAVRALLDNSVRKKVLELFKAATDFAITGDRIGMVIDGLVSEKLAVKAVEHLVAMLKVSDFMTDTRDVKGRLIRMLETDDAPGVKIFCIRDLANMEDDGHDRIQDALRRALDDRFPEVRLEAARHLGGEGLDRMIRFLDDRSFPDEIKCGMIDVLERAGRTISAVALKRLYEASRTPELRIRIIDAMVKTGTAALTDFLEDCLSSRENGVVLRAAKSLGDCGTVDTVERLYQLVGSSRSADTRAAARESIARIQSRLGPGKRGWLSVSELAEKEGALSVPQGTEGALSMGEESGQPVSSRKRKRGAKTR